MRIMITALFVCLLSSIAFGENSKKSLIQNLAETITNLCPEAITTESNNTFLAKYDTMTYTAHRRMRNGAFSPKTHQEEGPNHEGFILKVTLVDAPLNYGGLIGAQIMSKPYYESYVGQIPIEGGKKHYHIQFSYGNHLNYKLGKVIYCNFPPPFRQSAFYEKMEYWFERNSMELIEQVRNESPLGGLPKDKWPILIKEIGAIRIYNHMANVVIVILENETGDSGIYVYQPISSYLPTNSSDWNFEEMGPNIWKYMHIKKSNQQVDPIVTTPVDKVEAQSTQGHP